jgi:hypothetical protein
MDCKQAAQSHAEDLAASDQDGGHTIKYFKLMNHSVATIEWLGGLGWISSQFYEAAHLQLKWLYHSTTKRISGDK